MNFERNKNNIDFFKELPKAEKAPSAFIQRLAKTKLTTYKLVGQIRPERVVQIGLVLGIILCIWLIAQGIHTKNVRKTQDKMVAQQIEKNKEAQSLAIAQLEKDKQIKADEINNTAQKQQISIVKTMTDGQIESIKSHILKVQNKELIRLSELYWTMVFINENDTKMDMEQANISVRQQFNTVNTFYSERIREITSTYQFIKGNHLELIKPTHDGLNSTDRILYWDNAAKNNDLSFLDSTDKFISDGSKYLKNPEKLAKYLDDHRALINSKKLLN